MGLGALAEHGRSELQKMISVVIPLYNKELSIKSTLQSVLAQTYTDFEVVVVDDGSIDKSVSVVKTIADNRIRLIHKTNGGVSSARNRGIQEAKGSHIAFLDGDDYWEPNYLEELARLIDDFPNAVIYGVGHGVLQRNEKHKIANKMFSEGFRGVVENVWSSRPYYWTGSSSCSSRALLLSLGGFDTRMTHGEDLDMWWRLLLVGDGVFYNKTLAYYVQDSENRAMNRVIPLESHIPYFIDKYAEARVANPDFRKFFDEEMAQRLYPYLFEKKYRAEAESLLKKIDWSQQKKSLYWRMRFPYLYKAYIRLKKGIGAMSFGNN